MKKLTKKVEKEIIEFVKDNQPTVYWDSQDSGEHNIESILEKGLENYLDELYEFNMDYVWELENGLMKEVQEMFDEYDPEAINDIVMEHVCVDMNTKELLNNIPEITCLLYVYSNYDCCNSYDRFEDGGYLPEVYKRVKVGVKKEDYLYEFDNGAYGGCLFCFVFKTDIEDFLELKEELKTGKEVIIPKGTQFGFFSSFQGAGTVFEKRTYRKMTMPILGDTEYDTVGIRADIEQSYSMKDVYGDTSFVDSGCIEIK